MNTKLRTIVCVEDEPDIQTITKLALEDVGGFTVSICSSGEEALRIIPEIKPDLILLDVMMPGMDGPSTLQAIRKHEALASIPVVFMTAKAQPSEIGHYRQLGAVDVITKPFDPMTLADKLQSIWSRLT